MNQLQTFYQTIRDRMRNLELDVSNLTPQSIGFLFNTLQHLQTRLQRRQYYQSMNNLLNSNISIDNDDLLWLLGLRQVNLEEEVLDNDIVYYIRSWTVQAPILQQLIIEMGPEALEFEEVESWLDYATQNPNQPLYIRYVGRCTGPTTPVDRHLEDIARAGGVLGYFLQALRQVDVIAFNQATLFELNAAHYQAGTATARDIDLREQIIINFLGLDNLMNQQPGGSHASYMPRRPIFIRHQQLYPTTFFQDFFTHSNLTDNEPWIIESMGHWVHELSMQARFNREATDTINNPMSHDYIEAIANQATPQRLINDRVVSIIIGKDVTLNAFNNPSRFLTNNPGYAPTLTRENLFRLCAWSQNCRQWNNNDETLVQQAFPFIDMYPWLGTSNSAAPALNQLRLYLHLWSPIVISTMPYEVSSAAFANFLHTHGIMTTESYIGYVGVPRIVHYPTLEWLYNRDEDALPNDQSTIAIPHIDPGFPKYGARSQQLLQIIDLTWAITTIINEITVRVLQGNNTDSTETIVMLVWNQCNPQSTALDARLQQLYNDLNASKNDYQQYRQQRLLRQRPAVRNINTQALELASAQRIELGGEAEGQPFSEVREVQVNALWKRNLPDLHLHISRNNKEQWLQWARSLNQGIYFYTSSLRRSAFVMRERHPLYNVLTRFPPEDVHDDTWMEDPELVRRSLTRWSRHSMTFLPQNHFAPQAQRRRRLAALEQARPHTFDASVYEYRNSLENQRVYVPRTNPIVFYWNDGNEDIRVRIRPQRGIFAPDAPETARFYHVHFLADGIGLQH
ncbi:hypothetical protein BDC45DRAFT_569892 [Circinella umbellata]|nr:hypothetical protein BDC45DRAFT_569892 [Circinella umbellata]